MSDIKMEFVYFLHDYLRKDQYSSDGLLHPVSVQMLDRIIKKFESGEYDGNEYEVCFKYWDKNAWTLKD